jgi:hypothetical protein
MNDVVLPSSDPEVHLHQEIDDAPVDRPKVYFWDKRISNRLFRVYSLFPRFCHFEQFDTRTSMLDDSHRAVGEYLGAGVENLDFIEL